MPTGRQVAWAKFRVSAVTLLGLTILVVLFYLLTGGTLLEPKATIYLYVADSTGLDVGAPVRVDGIDVGKVSHVALSGDTRPNRIVRVAITVGSEWLRTIPEDSHAELSSDSMIGDKFVDVTSGVSRRPIRANSELRYKETSDVLQRLDLHEFREQLRAVDAEITDIEQGRGPVGQLVQGSGMYDEWHKLLVAGQKSMHAIAARESQLGSMVYSDQQYETLRKSILTLDQALARLQSGQGDLGRLLRDDAQYRQLTAGLVSLRQSIDGLRAGPWLQSGLQSGLQSAADYGAWSRGLGGLIRSVDEFNTSPLMSTAQVYESLNGMSRELQHSLGDFRQNPQKYLRIKLF